MSSTAKKVVKIGVFVPRDAQLLDLACVDIFHMMSREYLSLIPELPAHIVALAPSVQIYYITSSSSSSSSSASSSASSSSQQSYDHQKNDDNEKGTENDKPAIFPLTANLTACATFSIPSSPSSSLPSSISPGNLDIVLVPGPDPSSTFDEASLAFLRAHADPDTGTDILSVCTGILLCGAAGLLDSTGTNNKKDGSSSGSGSGRIASGPRGLQDLIRQRHPDVRLVGDRWRWVQDGNFWSSGGITNGNDMVAAYARANNRLFPPAIVEIACKMADVGDRPQEYGQSQTVFTLGFAWQIVRAWFTSS